MKALIENKDLTGFERAIEHLEDKCGRGSVKTLAVLNVPDEKGLRHLHHAAINGLGKFAKCLIEAGATVDVIDAEGCTPLHHAAINNPSDTAQRAVGCTSLVAACLIKAGAAVDAIDSKGRTPLHYAAMNGELEIIQYLVKAGATLDVVDTKRRTPLHYAAMNGELEIIQYLVKAGATLDVVDNKGRTPLHYAAIIGDLKMVERIIEAGATLDVIDAEGRTPLQHAVANLHQPIVCALFNAGAIVDGVIAGVTIGLKITSLHYAAISGNLEAVQRIIGARARTTLDMRDAEGRTPLHHAAINGRLEIADCLIKAGANPHVTDDKKHTPVHYAERKSKEFFIELVRAIKAFAPVTCEAKKDGEVKTAGRWSQLNHIKTTHHRLLDIADDAIKAR